MYNSKCLGKYFILCKLAGELTAYTYQIRFVGNGKKY